MSATKVPLRAAARLRHHRSLAMPATRPRILRTALLAVAILLIAGATVASARGGGGGGGGTEVRAQGTCGKGATAKIRLRGRDGGIRVRFEVDHHRSGVWWRVVLIQDRRVVWRGRARTGGASASFEVERFLRDLPGADQVTARAWGPGGLTCAATATLPG